MSSQAVSVALVERLFSRFVAYYGSQKVGAMWADADVQEVKAVWARALMKFDPKSIGGALDRLIESGREWPPTLPEFVELCRQSAIGRQQHAPAVLLQMPRSSPDVANRHVKAAASALASKKPSREWASRLLARHEAGEHFSISVLNMARAALGARDEAEA